MAFSILGKYLLLLNIICSIVLWAGNEKIVKYKYWYYSICNYERFAYDTFYAEHFFNPFSFQCELKTFYKCYHRTSATFCNRVHNNEKFKESGLNEIFDPTSYFPSFVYELEV